MPTISPDLIVTDLDRAVRFYKEALGLTEQERMGGFFAMLVRDGMRVLVETRESPDPTTQSLLTDAGREPRATINLYVSVDDLAVEEKRLRAAKIAFSGPVKKPYGMTEISLRDPDGYRWTFGAH